MRCFLGLPLPQAWKQALAALAPELKRGLASRLTWTRPGNWHLTLKFLGEIEAAQAEALGAALPTLRFTAFDLAAGPAGFFPNAKRPRVFWLGLSQGGAECAALAARVEELCAGLGFPAEDRPFAPHLTLARVREAGPDDWDQLARRVNAHPWPLARVDHVALWQSVLSPQGPEYRELCAVSAS